MSLNIRGDVANLSFFVVVTEMSSSDTTNNGMSNEKIFMNLRRGVGYDFEVRIKCLYVIVPSCTFVYQCHTHS